MSEMLTQEQQKKVACDEAERLGWSPVVSTTGERGQHMRISLMGSDGNSKANVDIFSEDTVEVILEKINAAHRRASARLR